MKPRILIVAHVFYLDLWPELFRCIRNIGETAELMITYVDDQVPVMLAKDVPCARFLRCENRGYDVWPFLKALQTVRLSDYDYVVKLHTKRDIDGLPGLRPFLRFRVKGPAWRHLLMSFCSTPEHWARSLACLERPEVGMVSTIDLILRPTRRERERAAEWLLKAPPSSARYVAGTMFVARAACFEVIDLASFKPSDFDPTKHDGRMVMAHTGERLLGLAVFSAGYRLVGYDGGLLPALGLCVCRLWTLISEFFFEDKVTSHGYYIVKILKIPVYHKKVVAG